MTKLPRTQKSQITKKCTRVADRAFSEVKLSRRQPGDFYRSVLMNSLPTLLVILFALVTGCAPSNPAAPASPASNEWDRVLGWPKPFDMAPTVEQVSQTNNRVIVRITNNSQEPLSYQGTERDQPQEFIEVDKRGVWILESWNWCGFGMSEYLLDPGQSQELTVDLGQSPQRERVLICLTGVQSNQCQLIPIAAE
jgi:hypothetical protein